MIKPLFYFLASLVISLLITYPILSLLRLWRAGQPVRAEGPATHQTKTGTPTLGGIGFILVIVILSLILLDVEINTKYLALLLLVLAFALIGLSDDLLKLWRKQNLGLTFWEKILSQVALSALFALVITDHLLSQLWVIFIVVGSANATNLTDGLNGLLAGTATIAFLAFALLAGQMHLAEAQIFALIAAGAIAAFLYYNFPKAQLFMGDVGALAIGAALAGLALIMHKELRLAIIGGIFVVEALSVILQVTSYKLFKRRVFKMTPLHHHFELLGIGETQVVVGFWVVGLILAIIGVML